MFGGDEVGAMVVDLGTCYTKAGYAGQDTPRIVIPSAVGITEIADAMDVDSSSTTVTSKKRFAGNQALALCRDDCNIVRPVKDGLIDDWDAVETIYNHIFSDAMSIDSREHPMLLSEPAFNTKDRREKLCEIMFETFNVPAVFLCKDAVLSSFAVGRSTALVLNCGGSVTTTVPVHDGYVLRRGMLQTEIAGDFLDSFLEQTLLKSSQFKDHQKEFKPRFEYKREFLGEKDDKKEFRVTELKFDRMLPSFRRFGVQELLRDIKETVCQISDIPFDVGANAHIPKASYELPDGNVIEVGTDRFSVPEIMFNPQHLNITSLLTKSSSTYQFQGIHKMIQDTVQTCHHDIQRELFANVVLNGGSTLFNGFAERLQKQIATIIPAAFRFKILQHSTVSERRFGVWIGGSILGSLGTFQQMWFSKSEYAEHGASHVEHKCQ